MFSWRWIFLVLWSTDVRMPISAIIPFKPVNPKTRLSTILDRGEREEFARAMLEDVVAAVRGAGAEPRILSTHPPLSPLPAEVTVTPAGLNEALNECFSHAEGPLLLIMADLPLATPEAIQRMLSTLSQIALVPGRGGGTNAIFLLEPRRFRADFYGASFLKHMRIAAEFGCSVEVVDSFRLHTDIDEKEDLVEVILHGTGKSRAFLESRGFSLVTEHGRVSVKRHPHKQTR
jgi:2-phospho-L-lactate guanylyltransferase